MVSTRMVFLKAQNEFLSSMESLLVESNEREKRTECTTFTMRKMSPEEIDAKNERKAQEYIDSCEPEKIPALPQRHNKYYGVKKRPGLVKV